MSGFLGSYEYQLDEKGRVSLPADFRRKAEDGAPFVLLQSLQSEAPCLVLYPESAWWSVRKRLADLRESDRSAKARAFLRWVNSTAQEVTPDKQGRINIPDRLREVASLDGAVLVVGVGDRIEIWDPGEYRRYMGDPAEDFADLADEILF